MFEAIHGTAPDIGGKNIANPSGLLQGAIMMLNHIGQSDVAEKIQNAWLKTIEDGIHTSDIYKESTSKQKVGTIEFTKAVIQNLGLKPNILSSASFANSGEIKMPKYIRRAPSKKELVGVDMFTHWGDTDPNILAEKINSLGIKNLELSMITNRGIKVWPNGFKETFCTDHWRCRFKKEDNSTLNNKDIIDLLQTLNNEKLDIIKTENLYSFDGKNAFSLGQGQ
jgi:isocitrate dehydrogenase